LDETQLKLASEKIPNRNILINIAARRAKELARGANPMVAVDRLAGVNHLDVALREIAEGKISYEEVEQ